MTIFCYPSAYVIISLAAVTHGSTTARGILPQLLVKRAAAIFFTKHGLLRTSCVEVKD